MLRTSEVAKRLNITYSQVQDMIDYGYLPVADVRRCGNGGIVYLFSENQLESIDVAGVLAEIRELKSRGRRVGSARDFKRRQVLAHRHERFMQMVAGSSDSELFKACYYLFHLNHYAKAYPDRKDELYSLKNQVLRCMVARYPGKVCCLYLVGADKARVWLCEDCSQTARLNGCSYQDYISEQRYCCKCEVQVLEREYYSLIEFVVENQDLRFSFHLPVSKARKWMCGIEGLPRFERGSGEKRDEMYFYGRRITRVEEKIVPLAVAIKELRGFIEAAGGD